MKSLLRIALVSLWSLSLGAGAGLYTYYKSLNPADLNTDKIQAALEGAVVTLANCSQFKTKYPAAKRKLVDLARAGIYFRYENLENKRIIALAEYPNTIVLTDTFFSEPPASWEAIIAHELLHLSGLPPHSFDKLGRMKTPDTVYTTTRLCYSNTHAETNPRHDASGTREVCGSKSPSNLGAHK